MLRSSRMHIVHRDQAYVDIMIMSMILSAITASSVSQSVAELPETQKQHEKACSLSSTFLHSNSTLSESL